MRRGRGKNLVGPSGLTFELKLKVKRLVASDVLDHRS